MGRGRRACLVPHPSHVGRAQPRARRRVRAARADGHRPGLASRRPRRGLVRVARAAPGWRARARREQHHRRAQRVRAFSARFLRGRSRVSVGRRGARTRDCGGRRACRRRTSSRPTTGAHRRQHRNVVRGAYAQAQLRRGDHGPDVIHHLDAEPHRSHRRRRHVSRDRPRELIAQANIDVCQADDERIHGLRIRRSLPFFADVMGQPGYARGDDVELPPLAKPAAADITFDDSYEFAPRRTPHHAAERSRRRDNRLARGVATRRRRRARRATCSPRCSGTSRTS